MEKSKHFDEQIRRTLEGLEREYDPGTWDMLQHKMDFAAQQKVDDLFKSRLGNIEPTLVPGSWDALAQRMEAAEAAEMAENAAGIDKVAYEKLHNFEVPFKNSHWALMAKRLEEEFSLRHKLYRYKVVEITLMALLLLTIFRFLPLAENWLQQAADQENTEQNNSLPVPATKNTNQVKPEQPSDKTENAQALGVPMASADIEVGEEGQTEKRNGLEFGGIDNGNSTSKSVQPKLDWPKKYGLYASGQNLTPLAKTQVALASNSGKPSSFEKITEENFKNSLLATVANNKDADIDLLPTIGQGIIASGYAWEAPMVEMPLFKKKSTLRFSIFTTSDLNYVKTPPNQLSLSGTLYQTALNTALASGYGGGVQVNFKKGRWEFVTGGQYSFKRYIPNTPTVIFESVGYWVKEDFHGIQLDIVQIPFNLNYHFKDHGKWRFYASAGASGHFITSSVYEIEYDRKRLNSFVPPSSPDESRYIRKVNESPDALFSGGSLKENAYMTANIGLGVERYIAPKWTIFFQPNYQHYLRAKGIGTNKDKIYTTSFFLGTKFNLK
ncbi:MAG TPA: hypothetical protein ENJ95_19185 [Bacteroidetes bacterium]|nr:hypothetical protein [Bacteroidota bacterium]